MGGVAVLTEYVEWGVVGWGRLVLVCLQRYTGGGNTWCEVGTQGRMLV